MFPLLSDPSARRFELTNPAGWSTTSNVFTVSLSKTWPSGSIDGSYVLARTESLGASDYRTGVPRVDDLVALPGLDPNELTNARGAVPGDRTHQLRMVAAYRIPRIDVETATAVEYASGQPLTEFVAVRRPQGTPSILVRPPARAGSTINAGWTSGCRARSAWPNAIDWS